MWLKGDLMEREQEESLALFEQAEDDEFRASLVECMEALDREDEEERLDAMHEYWLEHYNP